VTVTSDGKRTIKRIVTVRDGVEKVVTETTDENGTTTRSEGDSAPEVANPEPPGPWLGLRVKEASKVLRGQLELADDEGLVVDVLAPNGPAAKAGVVVGDLLLRFGDRPVSTPEELSVVTSDHGIGETVAAVIMRKAKRSTVEIKLEKRPDRRQSAPEGLTDGFEKSQDGAIDISVEGKHRGEALDAVLEDPDVPDSFKETVRRMQERFRDFERRHGAK